MTGRLHSRFRLPCYHLGYFFDPWPPELGMSHFGKPPRYSETPTGGFSYCWWYDVISFDETIKILVVLILFIMYYKCAGSFPWRVYRLDVEIWLWCKFLPRADATLPPIRELPSLTVSVNESACVNGVFHNIESVARTGLPIYIHPWWHFHRHARARFIV